MLIYKRDRQLVVLNRACEGRFMFFMVFTLLGPPSDCSLVSTVPLLVRKLHGVAGPHSSSLELEGVTSVLLCCATLGLI